MIVFILLKFTFLRIYVPLPGRPPPEGLAFFWSLVTR